MGVYSIQGAQATTAAGYKTAIGVTAGATSRRGKVFDINVGAQSAPASTDTNIQFDLSRTTAIGGGASTAYTPNPNDPADSAFLGVAAVNYTAEPTVTATSSVFNIGMNQRAPFRWQTYLGSGAELVYPATSANGFVLRVLSAGYTGASGGTIYVQEQ